MKVKKPILALALACAIPCLSFAKEVYTESLYPHWGQSFEMSKVLFEEKNDVQHMVIFENQAFGKVLALDGVIQTTEKDEFVYHEMITHVPILAHGNAKKVLIVGGGDGGTLREVVKHSNVEEIVLVEIDARVIDLCKHYFPKHSNGSYDDPRLRVVIQDAFEYAGTTDETFDVIICDSTDPIGPGTVLFTPEYFSRIKNILNSDGIFVNQCGVPFMQTDEMVETHGHLSNLFADANFYLAPVPTYVGGFMSFGWATNNPHAREIDVATLKERMEATMIGDLKYYTPKIHNASFVLPKFLEDLTTSS